MTPAEVLDRSLLAILYQRRQFTELGTMSFKDLRASHPHDTRHQLRHALLRLRRKGQVVLANGLYSIAPPVSGAF